MPYTITLSSPVKTVVDSDTYQLVLTFDVNLTDPNESHTFDDKGLVIINQGKLKYDYDFEDALMATAVVGITISDRDGYLHGLLYGTDSVANALDQQFQVDIKINGSSKYRANALEDTIDYDYMQNDSGSDAGVLTFQAAPKSDILSRTVLFDNDGNATNPLGSSEGTELFKDHILDIYQLVNSSLVAGDVNIDHSWLFKGEFDQPPPIQINNFTLANDIYIDNSGFFQQSIGWTTVADALKNWGFIFGSFTGMHTTDKVFFKELFRYNSGNTQTLGTILKIKKRYKFNLIRYVRVVDETDTNEQEQGTETDLQDQHLDKVAVVQGMKGVDSGNDYIIIEIQTPTIDTTYRSIELAIAKFWHDYRSDLQSVRVDEFTVKGIDYDITKDFTDNTTGTTLKYEPIGMEIDYEAGTTQIDGLFIGT